MVQWHFLDSLVSLLDEKNVEINKFFYSELLCYTYSFIHGDIEGSFTKQFCIYFFWIFFFGPFLFPVSLIVWHLVNICKGESRFPVAQSKVLSTLSVLTKSCLQLTLQVTILMITWYTNNNFIYHSYQLASISLSTLFIAKSCADHHYFEASGKSIMGKNTKINKIN